MKVLFLNVSRAKLIQDILKSSHESEKIVFDRSWNYIYIILRNLITKEKKSGKLSEITFIRFLITVLSDSVEKVYE